MAIYRDGRRLEGEEAEEAMERHQARMSGGGGSSRDKSSPKARNGGGSGGKGGGRPDISPDKVSESKYNTDNSYGYYDASGKYVPAFVDMRDGGGKNQSGNYFVGGGILSGLLNAAKVRPAGGAREMQDGEYVVPIADIGYRDIRDMFDRGGPQASGGRFQGGGQLSGLANLGYNLTGREFGERTPYGPSVPTAAPARTGGGVGGGSSMVTSDASAPSVNPYAVGGGFSETAPAAVVTTAASEDAYTTPRMYRSMDQQVGFFNQGQNSAAPVLPVGADNGNAELARLNLLRQQAVGNRPIPQDDMTAILSFGGGDRSTLPVMTSPSDLGVGGAPSDAAIATPPTAMTMFIARMNTVPDMLKGTQIEEKYRKYLLGGNTGTFDQFTGAQP